MAIEYHRRACRKCRAAHPDVAVDLTCPTGRALNKKAGKFLLEMMKVPG